MKTRGIRIDNGEFVYGCLVDNMCTYSELSNFSKGTMVCEIITGEYESDNWEEAINEASNVVTTTELSAKDKLKQKIDKLNTEFTNNYIE